MVAANLNASGGHVLRSTLAVSLLAACLTAPAESRQTPIVFTGASVIPMDRATVLANQTVIVESGRITYVGAPRSAPAGATVVDARGKFLMPAIAEFHAHV